MSQGILTVEKSRPFDQSDLSSPGRLVWRG